MVVCSAAWILRCRKAAFYQAFIRPLAHRYALRNGNGSAAPGDVEEMQSCLLVWVILRRCFVVLVGLVFCCGGAFCCAGDFVLLFLGW